MRRYRILITNPAILPPNNVVLDYTSTNPDGSDNTSALDISFDLPVTFHETPSNANGFVRVWGIPLSVIGQAQDLHGMAIQIYGGMSKSYPLNNPLQYGLLVTGTIFQAFGNWIGTDQTLDLTIRAGGGTAEIPVNLVMTWPKGTPLQPALTNALNVAFPGIPISGTLNPNLVQGQNEQTFHQTLYQLGDHLLIRSKKIIAAYYASIHQVPPPYYGVHILFRNNKITLFDGTTDGTSTIIPIVFTDLIGQPTWIGPNTIQLTCVLRSDLSPGMQIKMPQAFGSPQTLVTTTVNSYAYVRQQSVFQGKMQVNLTRHVGAFRQPDAQSWVTVLDAAMIP